MLDNQVTSLFLFGEKFKDAPDRHVYLNNYALERLGTRPLPIHWNSFPTPTDCFC
jgi:hypothetical protein